MFAHKKYILTLLTLFSCKFYAANNQGNQTNQTCSVKPRLHEYYVNPLLKLKVSDFKIVVNGYIKYEAYWDTRQVIGARADQLLAFPEPKKLDVNGKDINAKGQFQTVPIETRMRTTIYGPDVKNAKSRGVIEADFFGRFSELDLTGGGGTVEIVNIFRLRHAFFKLDWEKVSLLGGQFWHPMYVLGCYPDTISFNGGAPIEPFSRNPQLRVRVHTDHLNIITALTTQLTFASDGPDGVSATYMRNAVVPNLHLQLQGLVKDHMIGAAIDYKRLVPRIKTNENFKVVESINSVTAMGFICLSWPSFTFNTKITYAQNGTDYGMLGGYAVKTINPVTDERTYTNLSSVSWWADFIVTRHKNIEPGLFIGYIKNLGSNKEIQQDVIDNGLITDRRVFSFGTNVDNVFRIQPRIRWKLNKITIAGEIEYTHTAFGTINNKGKVENTTPVSNTRILFAVFYHF